MKLKIYLFLIVLFGLDPIAKAQIWQPLGPDDFNQPTYTTISDSDLAFNGSVPYIFHYNSWYYGDKGNKAVVMKYDASGVGWEKVESPVFSSKSPSFTKIAINEGVPYVFFADETHYGAATVMKLNKSGTSWEVVGKAGFSLGTYLISPSIAFNNGVPYVCYINGNSNGLTVMKLNANGTDWEVVGSNNISYNYGTSSAFLAFNEGVPYICFNGRIESTFELRPIIMKLNASGTDWEVVGTKTHNNLGFATDFAFNNGIPHVCIRSQNNSDERSGNTIIKLNSSSTDWEIVGQTSLVYGLGNDSKITFIDNILYLCYSEYKMFGKRAIKVQKLISNNTGWELVGNENIYDDYNPGIKKITFKGNVLYICFTNGSTNYSKPILKKLNIANNSWEVVGDSSSITKKNYELDNFSINNTGLYGGFSNTYPNDYGSTYVMKYNFSVKDFDLVAKHYYYYKNNEELEVVFNGSMPYIFYRNWYNRTVTVQKFDITNKVWEVVGNENFPIEEDLNNAYLSMYFHNENTYLICRSSNNDYRKKRFIIMRLNATGTLWEEIGILNTPIGYSVVVTFNKGEFYALYKTDGSGIDGSVGKTMLKKLKANNIAWEEIETHNHSLTSGGYQLCINGNVPYIFYDDPVRNYQLSAKKLDKSGNWEYVGPGLNLWFSEVKIAFKDSIPYIGYKDLENEGKATVIRLNASGKDWELVGKAGFSAGPITQIEYIGFINNEFAIVYNSDFSFFAKKLSSNSLPVQLTFFEAATKSQQLVELSWQTASEKENNYFTVSKSKDGKTFVQLSNLKSKGNTGSSYQTVDFSPYEGTSYYKLTQTDVNGKTEELGIKTVKVKTLKTESLTIFPNPVVNGIIHFTNTTLTGKQTLEIYDLTGKKLVSDFIFFENEGASYKINKSLSKGIYLLNISNQHQSKIIID